LYRVKRLWGGLCSIDRLSVSPIDTELRPSARTHQPIATNTVRCSASLSTVVRCLATPGSAGSRARAFIRTASRPAPPTGTRCLGPRQPRLPLAPPRHQCCQPRAKGPDWQRPGVSRRPPTPSHVGAACAAPAAGASAEAAAAVVGATAGHLRRGPVGCDAAGQHPLQSLLEVTGLGTPVTFPGGLSATGRPPSLAAAQRIKASTNETNTISRTAPRLAGWTRWGAYLTGSFQLSPAADCCSTPRPRLSAARCGTGRVGHFSRVTVDGRPTSRVTTQRLIIMMGRT